jgi:predicted TIM-barrel fold metal-dependent hydrolase
MFAGLKIIDSHAHFPVSDVSIRASMGLPEESRRVPRPRPEQPFHGHARRQWSKAWGFPPNEKSDATDEELAKRWVEELDKNGIDKIVWVTGGGNDRLSKIVQMAPDRFVGYAHHNPFAPDAADELERAIVKLGLKGYKLLAPALEGSITDRSLYPVWEVCAAHNIPVLIHFGILGAAGGTAYNENINPQVLEPVAKEFPDVNFIIPHFGCGHPRELMFLGWVCENIYVDTSGSNQWMRWMPYEYTVQIAFEQFYRTFGPHRIIFGTDSAAFPRGFVMDYLKEQNRAVRFNGISDEEAQLIFGGNMERLLNAVE